MVNHIDLLSGDQGLDMAGVGERRHRTSDPSYEAIYGADAYREPPPVLAVYQQTSKGTKKVSYVYQFEVL